MYYCNDARAKLHIVQLIEYVVNEYGIDYIKEKADEYFMYNVKYEYLRNEIYRISKEEKTK